MERIRRAFVDMAWGTPQEAEASSSDEGEQGKRDVAERRCGQGKGVWRRRNSVFFFAWLGRGTPEGASRGERPEQCLQRKEVGPGAVHVAERGRAMGPPWGHARLKPNSGSRRKGGERGVAAVWPLRASRGTGTGGGGSGRERGENGGPAARRRRGEGCFAPRGCVVGW
ncbi:hypothetical protein ERJ75_000684200 [Trypanosoma vivax]|nr:hypothetical protein ERJ75_000684200 [Trypanosoma vivax]